MAEKKRLIKAKAEPAKAKKAKKPPVKKPSAETFPVVGIGASAGGLEAIQSLLENMPPDTGMAFVVVSHLDPGHASMLTQLLKRYTKMTVLEAQDGLKIEPDHIYVIPPNKYISAHNGKLFLTEPIEMRGFRMPIDYFFRSIAADMGERAVCIILSGTGSDGTSGLSAIREAGGMSMVQSEESAKYLGMPRSAILTGLVDYVLPVEKMPEQLMSYMRVSHPRLKQKEVEEVKGYPVLYQKILAILRMKTGHDFSSYKKSTIMRRIERRMNVHETNDAEVYIRYLQENAQEVNILLKELLISVTNFFRDTEAFSVLRDKVLPELLRDKTPDYQFRAWVPGCATGEEAYSIAMVAREYMDEKKLDFKIQIFGTDIDEEAISVARSGVYPANIEMDVSADRLKRFFVKEDGQYKIRKELRESTVFAVQNVIRDAPFTKLDLVSCRNLLIYFDADLQGKVIPLFHYSLKPGGILFLGSSEGIGSHADLFSIYDKKWKFYKKKGIVLQNQAGLFGGLTWTFEAGKRSGPEAKPAGQPSVGDVAKKLLTEHFLPPSVVVNGRGDIIHIQGRTGKYLEPAPGKPGMNILEMAREGLQLELRAALHKALTQKGEVVFPNLRVRTNGDVQPINLKAVRMPETENVMDLILVIFEDIRPAKTREGDRNKDDKPLPAPRKVNERIRDLEGELKSTKENLQSTIEELQASNEELKSANEELQSTNEELQSTNEELETSKEEMQSVNEELATVNSELSMKIEQLSRAENDMRNLLDSTHIGIIFIDHDLKVKRFTSEATKVINLIPSDIGRPIGHIVTNLDYGDLVKDARKVLQNLTSMETEVRTKDKGRLYLMRIMPYRTVENVIDGVTVTFTDINQLPGRKSRGGVKRSAF